MSQVEKIVKAFKYAAQNSAPVAATVLHTCGSCASILSTWSQRNFERKSTVQLQLTQLVDWDKKEVTDLGSVETTAELMAEHSPSATYRALFRETPATGKNPKKQFLEVWKKNKITKVIDLTALEVHGDVYTDYEFGSFEWSQKEDKLLFIAEKKCPKSEPFISTKSCSKSQEEGSTKGSEYVYLEDWGESLVGKSCPVAVVCDLGSEDVRVLEGVPEDLSVGQVVWAPNGDGVVGVAWQTTPRRLGIVYCTNRTSWIFHLTPDNIFRKLSGPNLAVRSPQFSPDGRSLVWLERPAGGPHHACHRLIKYDWESNQLSTVIDIVQEETKCVNGEPFFGLYNMSLRKCWLSDSKTILLSTQQRASVQTYLIDTESKTINHIGGGGVKEEYSQGLLYVKNDVAVCWTSSLLKSPGLLIAKIVPDSPIIWFPMLESEPLDFGKEYNLKILHVEAEKVDPPQAIRKYSAIYVGPKVGMSVPLILWPHGGPHSSFSNTYSTMATFFASLGFAMLMVNYRGSIGSGQSSVDFLLGRVGTTDVSDMHQVVCQVIKENTHLDPNKCVLFGGSHGGFLVLHLSGQYPSEFKSCVALNPVVDLPTFSGSDIPDWAVVEAGFDYTPTLELTSEMFEKMRKASPIQYVPQVEAPTLLLLGKKDLRVPCYQGLAYYHALKARNVKTKVLMYDDNHPLSQTMHEADFAINTVLWFLENINHEIE